MTTNLVLNSQTLILQYLWKNNFFLNENLLITRGFRFEYIKTESEGKYQQINFDNAGNVISQNELQDNNVLEIKFALF
jgi:Fe(3+) dicitrate transport protein